jgi:hypothetical protein
MAKRYRAQAGAGPDAPAEPATPTG